VDNAGGGFPESNDQSGTVQASVTELTRRLRSVEVEAARERDLRLALVAAVEQCREELRSMCVETSTAAGQLVATALGAFVAYLDAVLPEPETRDAERLFEAGFFLDR
jgi:hypothetical protein